MIFNVFFKYVKEWFINIGIELNFWFYSNRYSISKCVYFLDYYGFCVSFKFDIFGISLEGGGKVAGYGWVE